MTDFSIDNISSQCANCCRIFSGTAAPICKLLTNNNEIGIGEVWSGIHKITSQNFQRAVTTLSKNFEIIIQGKVTVAVCVPCGEVLAGIYSSLLTFDKLSSSNSLFRYITNFVEPDGDNCFSRIPIAVNLEVETTISSMYGPSNMSPSQLHLHPPSPSVMGDIENVEIETKMFKTIEESEEIDVYNGIENANQEQVKLECLDNSYGSLDNSQLVIAVETENENNGYCTAGKDPFLDFTNENSNIDQDKKPSFPNFESTPPPGFQLPSPVDFADEPQHKTALRKDFELPLDNISQAMEIQTIGANGDTPSSNSFGTPGKFNKSCDAKTIVDALYVTCSVCKELLLTDLIMDHMLNVHNKESSNLYSCEYCFKVFLSTYTLQKHVNNCHNPDLVAEEDRTCRICSKIFVTIRALTSHERTRHPAVKAYKCEICNKTYAGKAEMLDHAAVHSSERPFQCDQCEKTFKRRKHLYYHKKSHRDEQMDRVLFTCTDCGKVLRNTNSLKSHRARFHRQTNTL